MKTLSIIFVFILFFFVGLTSINAQQNTTHTNQTLHVQKPFAIIEGIEAGLVELSSFLKVDSLKCSDKTYEIISFSMSLSWKGGDIVEFLSKSAAITPPMKEYLVKEEFGKKIWIENIKAKSPDGTVVELPYITLTIR